MRIVHLVAFLCGIVGLPGVVWALWVGYEPGIMTLMLVVGALFGFLHLRGISNPMKRDERNWIGIDIAVITLFSVPMLVVCLFGFVAVTQITGPYAYQFETDFELATYSAPDGAFGLRYPADWRSLEPDQVRAYEETLRVEPSTVLMLVNPNNRLENLGIQIYAAPYDANGEIHGDEEDELEEVVESLAEAGRLQMPGSRIDDAYVEEEDGIAYLTWVMTRPDGSGRIVTQRSTSFVANGKQVTVTATAPRQSFAGLNRNRFEPLIKSIRLPAGGSEP